MSAVTAAATSASAAPPEAPPLTLGEALAGAQRLHRAGHLAQAEQVYRAVLGLVPDHPDATHFLGILKHQQGDSAAGVALVQRAITLMPGEPGPWNNLGNIRAETGHVDAALQAYGRCLELAPDFPDTHNNLGTIHRSRGHWAEAEASYHRALAARPDSADAYNNLSKLMLAQGRTAEAVTHACKVITLMPRNAEGRKLLGYAYYMLGRVDDAAEVYREWLADEPDNPIARHHLAACSGQGVPARASDAYVTRTFDAFAASFDAKLQMLDYRAPQIVATALGAVAGAAAAALEVLDAGCGTGLCGPLLRPYARRLVGVDLSARMLDRARARGSYDALVEAELGGYLESQPAAFDVIVSADTLCYFGALDDVTQAAQHALRSGGLLFFTVEALADDEPGACALRPHGRYAHARGHVEACLAAAGLELLGVASQALRSEGGLPVNGWVVSARKPAAALADSGEP